MLVSGDVSGLQSEPCLCLDGAKSDTAVDISLVISPKIDKHIMPKSRDQTTWPRSKVCSGGDLVTLFFESALQSTDSYSVRPTMDMR